MKRRFRILVALVMSLTMMFGMSTTAFADINWDSYYRPESVNSSSAKMIYVVDIDDSLRNPVLVFNYNADGTKSIEGRSGLHCNDYMTRSVFADDPEVGKVYIWSISEQMYRLDENNPNPYLPPSPSPSPSPSPEPSPEPNGETPSMTAEQIVEQRAEAEQKAVEEKIAEEKALPVTEFTSESAVNSMPAAAKSTGASANLSKITTMQGFSSAVTKLAASAKASITNRNGVASVTVYTDRPMTFSTDMLDAIYATDINFEYVFRYEGKLYKITIPRGVKVDLGESRYEGPLCVGKILGTTQVIE